MDDELKEIVEDYNLTSNEAEEVQGLADELGVGYDDANEIREL